MPIEYCDRLKYSTSWCGSSDPGFDRQDGHISDLRDIWVLIE